MQNSGALTANFGMLMASAVSLLLLQGSSLSQLERSRAASPEQTATAARAQIAGEWSSLPLRFEKNVGQTDRRVQYVARGGAHDIFLSGTEAFFVLNGSRTAKPAAWRSSLERVREARQRAAERVTLRMEIAGANPASEAQPLEALETRSNYLIGSDPAQWHTGIVNYAKVRYPDVYPGVDLIYYGRKKQFEYDFVVAPGRDPARIRLRFTGADAVEVNGEGELVLRAGGKELRQQRPVAYQLKGGERQLVEARYEVQGKEVGFALGACDSSRPLTIDPSLLWSTYFGGSGDETGFAIAVGPGGSVFVTGVSSSANLPTTAGVVQPAKNGAIEDAFILKLNANGTTVLFCTYLGGTDYDEGDAIIVDAAGNFYVAGITVSANFPGTAGHAQPAYNGLPTTGNGFIAKLNNTGTALTFATYLGGGGPDGINDIALDAANNIYVTGFTLSGSPGSNPAFPTTAGVWQSAFGGTTGGHTGDAFVTKLAANGNSFLYSTYLGGAKDDEGWGIKVDAAGNAYVAGETESANFPTTLGTVQPAMPVKQPDRLYSGWIAEINPAATALVYSTYLGGNRNDHIFGLARVAASGNVYVTGTTTSTNLPTTAGALQPAYGGPNPGSFGDAFVAALNPAGTSFVYLTYLGGSGDDAGAQIRVDSSEFAYVAGFTSSMNFPVSATASQTVLRGADNLFVAKIRPGGTLIVHASYLGGTGTDLGFAGAIAFNVAAPQSIYFTGSTTGNGFTTTAGVVQTVYGGGATDAFVARYDLRAPTADFMPASLSFAAQTVGTMSAAMPITYKNIGNATMTINAIAIGGDFTQANTCGALPGNLAAGASCTINVTFKPTAVGIRLGTLTVTDTAPGSPHLVALMGTGQ